ncbi:MAG: ParA family protein [Gammaproteobacteria bacterium]|nr:ParA family protein [Gammaproteobacteria bacterium]
MRKVFFNQKGGVGKTTITCNLAAINAARGRNTLVIDLDQQGNSGHYLIGEKLEDPDLTIARFFKDSLSINPFASGGQEFEGIIHQTPFDKLSVIPAHSELDPLMTRLESRHKIYKLREAIERLNHYDDIYIDTPPTLNFYSRSALIAAETCLIPFDCDQFSRDALYSLITAVEEVRVDHNDALRIGGIIANQYQGRARLPQQILAELSEEGHPLLESAISPSVVIRESHSACQPMIHFSPKHKITAEYQALYDELQAIQ